MKVLILGYGVEGQSAYRYLKKHRPTAQFSIFAQKAIEDAPDGAEVKIVSDFSKVNYADFGVVVRSPSVDLNAIPGGLRDTNVTSVTKIFFDKCPASIIGVTGTKGKGTTCSLIAAVLRAAGKTVHLVGNIGNPALDALDDIQPTDIVVYELSSFQLWDMKRSPRTAVIVHLEADHLDVHAGLEDYLAAKTNIVLHQSAGDTVVYDSTNQLSTAMAEKSQGEKIAYPSPAHAHTKGNQIFYDEQLICSVDDLKIPGAHNQMNALAAIDACWQYTTDPKDYRLGFSEFTGLPHRLKYVRTVGGVDYYDDSISTTIGSTIAAIKSFDNPKVLILGGSSKGVDFGDLVQEIQQSDIRQMVLMGAEADNIAVLLEAAGLENYTNLGADTTMDEAVNWAADSADSGDVVILSPACASFGMFKNYSDRGEQFVAAVEKLGEE